MTHDKKKKQDFGIFYTRQEIVNFIYDILLLWKNREDKENRRWELHSPKHYPSVIDPACGEGIFMKNAVEKGFTRPDWIFGLDIDEAVVNKWPEISLLDAFDGDEEKLNAHFFHQNGLKHIEWTQHKKQYYGRLKKPDIENEQFDLVIGNPPYGGIGLEKEEFNDALIAQLSNYKILPSELKNELSQVNIQKPLGLFDKGEDKPLNSKIKDRLKSFPIEVLFIDRFIQLAKPGGWIAIIIPDGILSNSNLHYVREYISKNAKVEAIVSLPRDAFKHVGTSAKTSILFLTKKRVEDLNYPVFLASLKKLENVYLNEILSQYTEFFMKQTLSKDKKVYSNDYVMVRVDKTMKNMMEEKPFCRWDVNYFLPQWADLISELKNGVFKVQFLKDFFKDNEWLLATDHVRASKGEKEGDKYPIEYYSPARFNFTGYDIYNIPHCSKNAYERMKRAQVYQYDLLLGGFGMGPTGKSVLLLHKPAEKAIVGNIFIIRTGKYYNPFVLDTFFKCKYGQAQFNRYKTGVAFNSLSNDEIRYLIVPIFPELIIKHIEAEYKKMAAFHDKAMEAKAKGDETGYKRNIETAESMLRELITKTEAVIMGDREDVG